jgi:hypothetical protein
LPNANQRHLSASRGKPGIRPLGAISTGAAPVDDSRAIRDATVKKATRYGNLEHPYLIAVNAESQHLDRIHMMEALFGRETFYLPSQLEQSSDPQMVREPDGLWTSPNGPRHTRVSAVLIASGIVPWSVSAYTPWLFHNPWATRAFPDTLDVLPHARSVAGEMRMVFYEGLSAAQLFELPDDWGSAN